MAYKMDENGRIYKVQTISVETVWGTETRDIGDIVSLFHVDRCEHDNTDTQPADPSVGYMSAFVQCEDCGKDITDMCDDREEWDDGDRAYDAWKDEREYDRY